jgi:hypothetical protein
MGLSCKIFGVLIMMGSTFAGLLVLVTGETTNPLTGESTISDHAIILAAFGSVGFVLGMILVAIGELFDRLPKQAKVGYGPMPGR